jgi:hypothetical protein
MLNAFSVTCIYTMPSDSDLPKLVRDNIRKHVDEHYEHCDCKFCKARKAQEKKCFCEICRKERREKMDRISHRLEGGVIGFFAGALFIIGALALAIKLDKE